MCRVDILFFLSQLDSSVWLRRKMIWARRCREMIREEKKFSVQLGILILPEKVFLLFLVVDDNDAQIIFDKDINRFRS